MKARAVIVRGGVTVSANRNQFSPTQTIGGVEHYAAQCWCARSIVYVPTAVLVKGRTYACSDDCG